ncbi:MAG: FKBP-type peptidyl-prolyl cis-trans isomerase [Epsilonproteobacteria bacterium]|nr:MAG: FKBP-type peptidyl-prolyl cis-trans isomerase [Campylobacterota bacterium]RLA66221.1 MAG: FKBP-type peptidyl-prolyl cis-trans isomerase [Campylobacterota bacterium]
MKKSIILTLVLGLFLVSCKQSGPAKVELKTEEDKTFYALGVMFGSRLNNLDLTDQEIAALMAGLRASARREKTEVDIAVYQQKVHTTLSERMKSFATKVKTEGSTYLDNFVKDGAKKTKSGLAYKIENAGNNKKAKATDVVDVHYHGTLIDGTVFDSSKDRKKSVSFPLNRVIKGWTEGLQLIGEGGKVRLVIPSDLAYGDNGAPPKIPGGATLIFDVELISIKKETAPPAGKGNKKSSKKGRRSGMKKSGMRKS